MWNREQGTAYLGGENLLAKGAGSCQGASHRGRCGWRAGREWAEGASLGGHRVCEGLPGVLDLHSRSWLGPRHAPGAGGLWVWGNLASEGEASPGESGVKLQLSGRACEAPSPGTSQGQGRARR